MTWEADTRPLGECLKAWHSAHGWTREQAAAELRVAVGTYHHWCSGLRSSAVEGMVRRMMDLIDAYPHRRV